MKRVGYSQKTGVAESCAYLLAAAPPPPAPTSSPSSSGRTAADDIHHHGDVIPGILEFNSMDSRN
jgi:hypothetical protein